MNQKIYLFPFSLSDKAHTISAAPSIVAYFSIFELVLKGIAVGKAFHLTSSGVSMAVRQQERTAMKKNS